MNRINVTVGPHEARMLITGRHTVADIYCLECETLLGWKYEEAFEESQKYKVHAYQWWRWLGSRLLLRKKRLGGGGCLNERHGLDIFC